MKKDYIKPEIHIDEVELENQLLANSFVDMGGTGGWDSKDREDSEGEEDSSWGNLW